MKSRWAAKNQLKQRVFASMLAVESLGPKRVVMALMAPSKEKQVPRTSKEADLVIFLLRAGSEKSC